ncbi:MAG: tRNA lysidine(34) synthetase TilS [Anaerolineales bacterium]
MIDDIIKVLKKYCQLQPNRLILVGVSGGPDSVCLLHLLVQHGYPLVIAHLNHGLRPEASDDADFVYQLAHRWKIPFVLGQQDVAVFARQNGYSLEEGARVARYRFLLKEAAKRDAQAIAVAHTADDQVETVLMHLLRGAGTSGLRGMAFRAHMENWEPDIPLVRPLLSTWRSEILDYLEANQLSSRFDQSNLDTRFYRNRLRHELIPLLETYNPAIRRNIWQMAEILRADDKALDEATQAAWVECLHELGAGYVILNGTKLNAQNTAIQRRLLRKGINFLRPGLRDIGYDAIARAVALAQSPTAGKQITLGAGLHLHYEANALWLASAEADLPTADWPQIPSGEVYQLPVPGELALSGGWLLRAEIPPKTGREDYFDGSSWPPDRTDPYQAWIDADQIQTPLQIRTLRSGDRFLPLGMNGHSLKLSDFMINIKLPQRARGGWPLVISGNSIAWIPGLRLAHPFRITPQTRRQIHLSLEHPEATSSEGDN